MYSFHGVFIDQFKLEYLPSLTNQSVKSTNIRKGIFDLLMDLFCFTSYIWNALIDGAELSFPREEVV